MNRARVGNVGSQPGRLVGAIATTTALIGASIAPGWAGEDVAGPGAVLGTDEAVTVTLITGESVRWEALPGGRGVATVLNDDEVFESFAQGDNYYVFPKDVSHLVGTTLDQELFNIPRLVELTDLDEGIPVIVTGARRGLASDGLPQVEVEREFSSIEAFSGTVAASDARAFGATLDAAVAQKHTRGTLAEGQRVWLDQSVEVVLEDSVPQTGAPQVWDAGYDGTGVTIAVLDTGIDETHPDIGGKVISSANFSSDETAEDAHGHGTHVAATAAGTGDASDGLRPGVAPGADLINGKVLNAGGSGRYSDIIAGMEWAVLDQDADIVNVSIGGEVTDGTDPLSETVNALSAEHDVVFVVAAGNDGPDGMTVNAPGAAAAALTVGAVTKTGVLADFSSRGPRAGDFAIKPDITAPGASITAARAAGTSMGSPVNDLYTRASGTSMATPHVAGAAALLRQQHPEWDAETLKGALIGTAEPANGLSVYEQGSGELDVAAASESDVVATPGTLNLGYYPFPQEGTEPVNRPLTFTNYGAESVTIDLAADVRDQAGTAVEEGMVTVEPQSLTLTPGEVAEVDVTVNAALDTEGLFGGSIVSSIGDVVVSRTSVGLYKEEEMVTLTIEGYARDGDPAQSGDRVDVINVNDSSITDGWNMRFADGQATVRVPPGTYALMGMIPSRSASGLFQDHTLFGQPEVELTEDTHLVWDATDGEELSVGIGDDATVTTHFMTYHRELTDGVGLSRQYWGGSFPYYSVGNDTTVTQGSFEMYTHWLIGEPGRTYDLLFPEEQIPHGRHYPINMDDLAVIEADYHSDLDEQEYRFARLKFRPYESFASIFLLRDIATPGTYQHVVSPGDTRWQQRVYPGRALRNMLEEPATTYEPGERLETRWFGGPRVPRLNEGNSHTPGELPAREGDVLNVEIPEWGDSQAGEQRHYGERGTSDTTSFRLSQDGEQVHNSTRPRGRFTIEPGPSRVRMELDVTRVAEWWTTSTATKTAWEFDTDSTSESIPLPLLQVDYDIDLDLRNQAVHPRDARGPFTVGLDVRHPRGVDGPAIEGARVWVSYDDGGTWDSRPVKNTGEGTFEVVMDRRDGPGHASLRVEAWDAGNNRIEQEITRAYALRP